MLVKETCLCLIKLFYRFSNLQLSSYSFVIIFFVLFCLKFLFYFFLQPFTVEIVLNEDFVEEDHVDQTEPDKNSKRKYRREWETDPQLKSYFYHKYYLNCNILHTCLLPLLN